MLWSPIATKTHAHERRCQAWLSCIARSAVVPAGVLICAVLGGCSGLQSVLNPRGVEAEKLSWLFWFFTLVCAIIWILVIAALLWGSIKVTAVPREYPHQLDAARERRDGAVMWSLVAATVALLIIFTVVSFWEDARLSASSRPELSIELTGYQWWWQIRYLDDDPSKIFTTANEIHLPIGKPVKIKLTAGDVIHSFWVPNVAGKMDLIPGQTNELVISTDHAGVYRGQCAEFCGTQHAKMGLRLVAQSPDDFDRWRAQQLQPAEADGEIASSGRRAFFTSGCFLCHTIRGIDAGGRVGPDLTHIGSRMAIAADTLPNTVGHIAGWITDPQSIKPGNNMPRMNISASDVNVLANYLEALK
jgi:cytochrome c oxidase subunit 2